MSVRNENTPAGVRSTAKQAGETGPLKWDWVERSVWTERMLDALERGVTFTYVGYSTLRVPIVEVSSPREVRPSTGEPDAGDPHVRFGGRGGAIQCAIPTPIG